ncbi:hypothetical protein, partial [Klebsiella quasipneumoniae]|uniref:hypothetical protein n=1 Tax=Klebsiella quasipneumoniae TaxID=1463165 RepID=UPI00237D7384
MKKLYSLLFLILLSMGILAGCGDDQGKESNSNEKAKTEQGAEAAYPVKIKDASDQEVTIDDKPEKIVSLIPSNTEIAF